MSFMERRCEYIKQKKEKLERMKLLIKSEIKEEEPIKIAARGNFWDFIERQDQHRKKIELTRLVRRQEMKVSEVQKIPKVNKNYSQTTKEPVHQRLYQRRSISPKTNETKFTFSPKITRKGQHLRRSIEDLIPKRNKSLPHNYVKMETQVRREKNEESEAYVLQKLERNFEACFRLVVKGRENRANFTELCLLLELLGCVAKAKDTSLLKTLWATLKGDKQGGVSKENLLIVLRAILLIDQSAEEELLAGKEDLMFSPQGRILLARGQSKHLHLRFHNMFLRYRFEKASPDSDKFRAQIQLYSFKPRTLTPVKVGSGARLSKETPKTSGSLRSPSKECMRRERGYDSAEKESQPQQRMSVRSKAFAPSVESTAKKQEIV